MTEQEIKFKILEWIGNHIDWSEDHEESGDKIVSMANKLYLFVNGSNVLVRTEMPAIRTPIKKTLYDKVLEIPIPDLAFSCRTANCLKNEGFITIGDLIKRSHWGVLGTPNFGRKSLNEIVQLLDIEYGLTWSKYGNPAVDSSLFNEEKCKWIPNDDEES